MVMVRSSIWGVSSIGLSLGGLSSLAVWKSTTQAVILSLRRIRSLAHRPGVACCVAYSVYGYATPTLYARHLILRSAQNDKGWWVLLPSNLYLTGGPPTAIAC